MTTEKLNAEFDEILKEIVGRFFRKMGFRRKAQNFLRVTDDITQTFNVQKSQTNISFDRFYFTFNFGFFNNDIYNITWDNDTQIEFPGVAESFIQSQLGNYSHKRDHWYELSPRIDMKRVSLDIKADLENDLKPLFSRYKSLEDLKVFVEKDERHKLLISPYAYIAFLMKTNQREKGALAIQEHYLKALSFKGLVQNIQYPYNPDETKSFLPDSKQQYIDNILRLAKLYDVKIEEKKPLVRKKTFLD